MTAKAIVYARDLMERDVITVTPETRILDLHRLFVEEEIHGAPVVGDDGVVVGVVSRSTSCGSSGTSWSLAPAPP